jgi:hypothetical protein
MVTHQIHYKIYQKGQNLCLYIPPGSVHPKHMLFSLVYGGLQAYHLQNTADTNFTKMAILLARRLCVRGYSLQTLLHVFEKAGNRLLSSNPRQPVLQQNESGATGATPLENPLVFHLKHHPCGVTWQQVCNTAKFTISSAIYLQTTTRWWPFQMHTTMNNNGQIPDSRPK